MVKKPCEFDALFITLKVTCILERYFCSRTVSLSPVCVFLKAQAAYRRQTSAARTCAAQVQQQQPALRPRGYGMEACADGPGDDFTDSPTSPLKENPKPAPRRYLSQGSQLQCPNCKKLFPHDLLENHMRDCTGDD